MTDVIIAAVAVYLLAGIAYGWPIVRADMKAGMPPGDATVAWLFYALLWLPSLIFRIILNLRA